MKFEFKPKGVCCQKMIIDVNENVVNDVQFIGGCSGNTQGVGSLIKGMEINEAISRLEGIRCGFKTTSCPDQLAKALKEVK